MVYQKFGILSEFLEYPDFICVRWALPAQDVLENELLLKICMNEKTKGIFIKRIELRNFAMNNVW